MLINTLYSSLEGKKENLKIKDWGYHYNYYQSDDSMSFCVLADKLDGV